MHTPGPQHPPTMNTDTQTGMKAYKRGYVYWYMHMIAPPSEDNVGHFFKVQKKRMMLQHVCVHVHTGCVWPCVYVHVCVCGLVCVWPCVCVALCVCGLVCVWPCVYVCVCTVRVCVCTLYACANHTCLWSYFIT